MNADHSRDDGYVVAEAAIVLPVMVAIVVSTIGLVFFAFVGLGLQDAVHSASRLLARGTATSEVRDVISSVHPSIVVTVTPSPRGVTVTARQDVRVLGGVFGGWSFPLERHATVPWEVGVHRGATGP